MVLRRWEPFRELRQMQENMNRLWRSFGSGGGEEGSVENWAIPLDVVQEGDNIIIIKGQGSPEQPTSRS